MSLLQSNKKPKLALLISPRQPGTVSSSDALFPFPFLGLTQLAATFPQDYRLHIADERVKPVSGKEKADIVFITALSSSAFRAYALADLFRQRDIPVVIGGVHATALPEEASQHATSVVIGEAENLMKIILNDFEQGSLAPKYSSSLFVDLDTIPPPAIHNLNWRHRLFLSPIQTSRGCPNRCTFCAVPSIAGHTVRLKSVSVIEKELESLSLLRSRNLFVVDDNFVVMRDRAMAIMELFRFYGFRWMGFSTLSVSEDEVFLQALRDSGCVSLFIGFESLYGQGKGVKNRSYKTVASIRNAIDRIHAYGIGIQGSFIFGFDEDTVEVFQETVSFIQGSGIELPQISILTPLPGTQLLATLDRDNRILHKNWSLYDMSHCVYRPQNMSFEELQQGYAWALKFLCSPSSILSRLRKRGRFKPFYLITNFSLHRSQTRLANSLWNAAVQNSLERRGLCTH